MKKMSRIKESIQNYNLITVNSLFKSVSAHSHSTSPYEVLIIICINEIFQLPVNLDLERVDYWLG